MADRERETSIVKVWIRRGKRLSRLEDIESKNGISNKIRKLKLTAWTRKTDQKPADNQANKHTLLISDLPDDCILMILEHLSLDPYETCQLMKVCKKFYEVCFSPRLWRIADFRFPTYLFTHRLIALDFSQDRFPYLSELNRRKMFAKFLVERKAILSHLRINFDIDKEMGYFRDFLNRCSLRHLKYVEIKWSVYRGHLTSTCNKLQSDCFREVLEKVSACSPDMYFLKCQLLGSCDMARALGSIKNLQCLNLIFIGVIDTKALEIILSSLSNLKELKIKVRQNTIENFKGYSLKSESLEFFEFSWSKGFLIREIHLPHLHTFMAVNTFELMQGISCPCLFELISNGCPEITRLNSRRSIIAGLDNFPLSEYDEREMYICQCDVHAPWRVQE